MLEIAEQFWAQNQESKSSQFHVTINLTLQVKRPGSFKQVGTFIKVASRKMAILFMAPTEFSQENCPFQGHLVTFKQKNLSMVETLEFLSLNHKLPTLRLTHLNTISLWWVLTGYLTRWKTSKFLVNFGTWKMRAVNRARTNQEAKNFHSLEKLLLELFWNQWKIFHMTT